MRIPGSLSLSPLEKRARGEVGGSRTLVGSNHPSLPYRADAHFHTSLGPTPPFTPYRADAYLIDAGRVPPCRGHPADVNKVCVGPIWCNAAGSPATTCHAGHVGGSYSTRRRNAAGSPAIARAVLKRPKFSFTFSDPISDAWGTVRRRRSGRGRTHRRARKYIQIYSK
jgi:hypothetical protein